MIIIQFHEIRKFLESSQGSDEIWNGGDNNYEILQVVVFHHYRPFRSKDIFLVAYFSPSQYVYDISIIINKNEKF